MTILVTGGAGFIGANFVRDWLRENRGRVVVLDKLTYAGNLGNLAEYLQDSRFVFSNGDICDADLVARLLEEYKPRAIVHFAAESHVDRSIDSAADFIRTNVEGTFCLLSAALNYWRKLADADAREFRFVHVSTDEVYGSLSSDDPPFCETTPYRPNSPYSASKAAADHLARAWFQTHGLPVLTTNCSNNYGPYQFPEKLIPLIVRNAIRGQVLPIYGDGKNVRDWIYVSDHCTGVRRVLEAGRPGEVYNLGGGQEKTNIEVVRTICSYLDALSPRSDGKSYADQISFIKDRPGHDRRYAINSSKAFQELGWRPSESFDAGVRKTVDWYLDNLQWVERIESGDYREWVKRQYADVHG